MKPAQISETRAETRERDKTLEWILRIALFGEFLGHGVFALQAKQRFVEMLTAMTGLQGEWAVQVIQIIGVADIAVAIFALFFPFRLMLLWAAFWGFATALARPIAGDPIWDFIERWANWGVPLALLWLRGFPKKAREWWA